MKRIVLIIAILLIASVLFAVYHQHDVKKGEIAIVPSFGWVEVLNESTVYSGNTEFIRGEFCSIQRGGTVIVIEVEADSVLARYDTPFHKQEYGAPCPCGIVFRLSKERFSQMTREFLTIKDARDKIADIIK